MHSIVRHLAAAAAGLLAVASFLAAEGNPLPDTQPLTATGNLSSQMLDGLERHLARQTAESITNRIYYWLRDLKTPEAYTASVQPNRERLARMLGITAPLAPLRELEWVSTTATPSRVAETAAFRVEAVRWRVFGDVPVEGLWLQPSAPPVARVIVLPDADHTPEMVSGLAPGLPPERQYARRLAENGCEVLIPTLLDRRSDASGHPAIRRTNQPHREWIYRQAFTMGRHPIGYEVQAAMTAADWLASRQPALKLGLFGHGEGGLLALYTAALDSRFEAVVVSGYFDARERLWQEPIYRNVFGLLREFGDAEIATLIAPRALLIEHSTPPAVDGPPTPDDHPAVAAPGRITTPDYSSVEREFHRAQALLQTNTALVGRWRLLSGAEGMAIGPGSERALAEFLQALGSARNNAAPPGPEPAEARQDFSPAARQRRLVQAWEEHTQRLFRDSSAKREAFFWKAIPAQTPGDWPPAVAPFKKQLWDDVIGRLENIPTPPNPRSRQILDRPKWTAYDVMLDVQPDIVAWGCLLLPKGIKPGEHRPVVVCQHGLEGLPADVFEENPGTEAFRHYQGFAARLADEGYIVFAPHNPYRGGHRFRQLQRQANPLGLSLFSFILAQHERILDWLAARPDVAPARIGFYGLSYGGKTAMRVPALLDRYALSICSGDFNDWVRKMMDPDFAVSYLYTGEYEMYEFGLGETFNYAEMAALIAPRPFMVERGHHDPVGTDEWVASEYARVRRLYAKLGIPERTEIEFFDGPHTIHGIGTFRFLRQHLPGAAPAGP